MSQRFRWGHVNINVSDLDASIGFYAKLGFEVMMPSIPYLNVEAGHWKAVTPAAAQALGIPGDFQARGCILQLGKGFPKLDLTEFSKTQAREPLHNTDRGIVRLCLASSDLQADHQYLVDAGVTFRSAPTACEQRMADVAVCVDPDGTLIELIQIHAHRWRS